MKCASPIVCFILEITMLLLFKDDHFWLLSHDLPLATNSLEQSLPLSMREPQVLSEDSMQYHPKNSFKNPNKQKQPSCTFPSLNSVYGYFCNWAS